MKIAHIYWFGPKDVGGISNMLIDEIENYSKKHEIYVLYMDDCDFEYKKRFTSDVRIVTFNRCRQSGLIGAIKPIIKMNKYIRKISPDIIIFHALNLSKFVLFKKAKRIGRIHNTKIPKNHFKGRFDHFVAISNAVKKDVTARIGIPDKKITVIYNGVYTRKFVHRKKFIINSKNELKIVQVSRLHTPQKAQDIFMRALSICIRVYGFLNWSYTLIGTGPSEMELRELSKRLNIDSKIIFSGQKSREYLYNNLHNYDLFVLPSNYEGLGNVLIEAMSAKIPIICTNIDGPKEILGDQNISYLFPPKDIYKCAELIFYIYSNYGNTEMINKVNSAYSFAQNRMDISQMASELEALYFDQLYT